MMIGIFSLLFWLLLIPVAVGAIPCQALDKDHKNPLFLWISGQILLWALFQLISVPLILRGSRFYTDFKKPLQMPGSLFTVVTLYLAVTVMLAVAGLILLVRSLQKGRTYLKAVPGEADRQIWHRVLWGIFWVLLVFQLIQAVRLTYGDGDDAFYVAVSTITAESNTMYQKLPYTGGTTGLDIRHGLAPFPVWIAFLSRMSGIRPVSVAHMAMPLMLIPMTYGIYYLIGRKLCQRKQERLPLFLVLTELLVLFGDYSFYSVENFMIARSRQGKAALGSIVIPMTIYLFMVVLERIQERRRIEFTWWLLLLGCVFTGCMCSTLGAVLLCMLTGITGICAAVCYKRWRILIPMALSCVPAVCYAVIYLLAE